MNDTISRQEAIDALDCINGVEEVLKSLPSAQPEIIYCRECRYWKTDHPTANGYHCCHRIHNAFPMREDDFCSRAERMEEYEEE